jgi:hypothetical protein
MSKGQRAMAAVMMIENQSQRTIPKFVGVNQARQVHVDGWNPNDDYGLDKELE